MADSQGFVSVASTSASDVAPNVPLTSGTNSGAALLGAPAGQGQGVAGQVVQLFKRSSHPTAAIFHVLFKALAILFYFFSGIITSSFVNVFVVVVVLMAFDFWTVKNVTGRLMVGLRWWNDVAEDGSSTWRYESIEDPSQVSRPDYVIFWYSLYLVGIAWGVIGFWKILTFDFDYALICGVSLVLVWSNVYGFWNCSSERARLEQSMQSAITQGTVAALSGKFNFGGLTGASASTTPKGADVV